MLPGTHPFARDRCVQRPSRHALRPMAGSAIRCRRIIHSNRFCPMQSILGRNQHRPIHPPRRFGFQHHEALIQKQSRGYGGRVRSGDPAGAHVHNRHRAGCLGRLGRQPVACCSRCRVAMWGNLIIKDTTVREWQYDNNSQCSVRASKRRNMEQQFKLFCWQHWTNRLVYDQYSRRRRLEMVRGIDFNNDCPVLLSNGDITTTCTRLGLLPTQTGIGIA
jgi:hypothetical protein